VSAWLFMVERSNGETGRTVRRQGMSGYSSLPVVELRLVVQNTGRQSSSARPRTKDDSISIKQQRFAVDASTRRRGEELSEIFWDDKFAKKLVKLDGTTYNAGDKAKLEGELARLQLFESVVLVVFIHARRCSTTKKFVERSNFLRVLVSAIEGTTQALVIPIAHQQPGSL
jgi:hypothetical protein